MAADRGAAEGWSLVARATLTLGYPIGCFLPVERSPGERSAAAGAKEAHIHKLTITSVVDARGCFL